MPTVPTFAVRETNVSRHNGGTSGAPLKPLRDPRFPHYAERRQSLGQQMLERWAWMGFKLNCSLMQLPPAGCRCRRGEGRRFRGHWAPTDWGRPPPLPASPCTVSKSTIEFVSNPEVICINWQGILLAF